MNHGAITVLALSAVLCAQSPETPPADVQATESWPQFLGARSTSRAVGASSLQFDLESGLRYQVALPAGESSPCVAGNHIFLTGYDGKQLFMLALDRATGKEQWRFAIDGPKNLEFSHQDAGVAMPTACANGERVFFYFPSYGVIARKHSGEVVWQKRLPEGKFDFGCGTSPALHDSKLYLLRDGCPDGKLYALHEATGEEAWAIPRPAFKMSHATPYFWESESGTELIIASSGSVISFDPDNGKETWRVEGFTPLVCTTPTGNKDRLYFAAWSTASAAGPDRFFAGLAVTLDLTEEQRSDPEKLFAVLDKDGDGSLSRSEMPPGRMLTVFDFLDRNADRVIVKQEWMGLMRFPQQGKNVMVSIRPGGKGDVTKTHIDWSYRRGIPYVASPLLYGDRIYLIKAGGVLNCIDAKTGKPRFRSHRLDDRSEYYATPIGVDGHVILCSCAGTVYVLKVADNVEIVHELALEEQLVATPAIVDGTIYIRTRSKLYAFGR